jgi:hypothetical protein
MDRNSQSYVRVIALRGLQSCDRLILLCDDANTPVVVRESRKSVERFFCVPCSFSLNG